MITSNQQRMAFEQEWRLAEHYFSKGKVGKALPHFRRALLVDPSAPKWTLRVGQCLDRMGSWDEAYQTYAGVLESLDRCDEALQREILQAYTNICHRLNRETEVIECLKNHMKLLQQTPALYYNLGLAFYKTSQFGEARDCFDRLKSAHPNNSAGYIGTAILFCHINQLENAVRELQVARAAVPHDVQIIENLAVVQMKMGNPLGAVSTLRGALSNGVVAKGAKILHLLGMAHLRLGELVRAEGYLRESLEMEKTPEALREMGWLRVARGDYADSIVLLKEALAMNPNDIWAKVDLAIAYFKQGVTVDAQILFNEARATCPTPEVGKLLDDLARVISAGRVSVSGAPSAGVSDAGRLP